MDKQFINFLKTKSIHSFVLAIEIFNKPTIEYKLESCLYSLCNAWELLLKYKLTKDGESIYYKDKKDRSLSITDCINKVFSNDKDPVASNLKLIVSFRNMSTHLFIPEYEYNLVPFLSFCVKSYTDKLYDYTGENISNYIKTDFLSLFSCNNMPSDVNLLSKYGETIKYFYDKKTAELVDLLNCDEGSSIAYKVNISLTRISNKSKSDFTFYESRNTKEGEPVKYIEKQVDINVLYPYTHHEVANEIDRYLKIHKTPFTPIKEPTPTEKNPNPHLFTTACLDVLIKGVPFKDNKELIYPVKNGNSITKKYSKKIITEIISLIQDNKDVVIEYKKRLTPGA